MKIDQAPGREARASRNPLARFWRSEDGALFGFMLMIFLTMFVVFGLAFDVMRFEAQRARLQSTLDRAVLAAASLDQELDPEEVVLDYFAKAGLGAYIDPEDITVDTSMTARRVTATARMGVGTTFTGMLGIPSFSAPAAGAAEESASQTEISLVLDVSGSMGNSSSSGYSKIYELREAAKDFANIVLCNNANSADDAECDVPEGTVSVTMVPYAEQVLAGEEILDLMSVTDEHDYSSCLTFSASDFEDTGLHEDTTYDRTGHFDPWTNFYISNGRFRGVEASNWTCKTDSWRQIRPLVGDAAELRGYIGSLGASGNTSIDVAMKWGTGFLDEDGQYIVEGLVDNGTVDAAYEERPLLYSERGVEKVIVLMTDGINTSQHYLNANRREGPSPFWVTPDGTLSVYRRYNGEDLWYHVDEDEYLDHPYGNGTETISYEQCSGNGWRRTCWTETETRAESDSTGGEAVQINYPQLWAEYSWDFFEAFSWLGSAGSSYGNGTKNSRLDDICDAAKDQDITIFTIGFEVTSSSASVMRNCATSDSHYFDVDGLDVGEAFAAIAREISKLRLVN